MHFHFLHRNFYTILLIPKTCAMQKISLWAKGHVAAARVYIVLIKLFLTALSYYTAISLYKMQWLLPVGPLYTTAAALLFAAAFYYPVKGKTTVSKKWFYIRQKTCDFLLPLSAVLVFTTWVNNADTRQTNAAVYGSRIIHHPTAKEILESGKTRADLTKIEKRILKKEFFKQAKLYAAYSISGDKAKAGEAWKIMLAIIGMIGLLLLLAALACSLSCGGNDTAAVLVGILGLVGIIWGFTALVKRIKRGPKTTTSNKEQ